MNSSIIEAYRTLKLFFKTIKNDSFSYLQSQFNEEYKTSSKNNKIKVMLYHMNGFSYGGTEKGLHFIAKNLDKSKYDVYFMAGEKPELFGNVNKEDIEKIKSQLKALDVTVIPFEFDKLSGWPAFFPIGANPSPKKIIDAFNIDLFITSNMGPAWYPIPIIKCPSIIVDVFGYGTTLISKVKSILVISEAVKNNIDRVVPHKKIKIMPWPVAKPPENIKELGIEYRKKHNIPEDIIVFGRIGRSDNSIFDPIAVNAFEKLQSEGHNNCRFMIVGPCEKLKKIVEERNIPNIIFIQSIALEEEVWAFHSAIDVLAHSRIDGESQGVNINESMAVGNPIISHKSKRWNAHLEYLTEDYSFIAETDDYETYKTFMKFFLNSKNKEKINKMREISYNTYLEKFSPEIFMEKLEKIIQSSLKNKR